MSLGSDNTLETSDSRLTNDSKKNMDNNDLGDQGNNDQGDQGNTDQGEENDGTTSALRPSTIIVVL